MQRAKDAVLKGRMTIRKAAQNFNVPKSTLSRAAQGKKKLKQGGQTALTEEEERIFCTYISEVGKWGFPFSLLDLRLVVKTYIP